MRKSTHDDRIASQLTHVARAELPDLCGDTILFHERFLGEVELEGIVRGQADAQSSGQIFGKWIAMIVEEQGVVAER